MTDLMVFSRAFCFDLIIKGDKAARDACAEISPFFGLVGRTEIVKQDRADSDSFYIKVYNLAVMCSLQSSQLCPFV